MTGSAVYTGDIVLPGTLVGKLLRSPRAHATIRHIDVSRALELPGVHAVLTGADLPVKYGILPVSQDETALAVEKVRFIGDPVAAVAARDEEVAAAALALITVEYEDLPPAVSMEVALRDEVLIHEAHGSNVLKEVAEDYGDVAGGFERADLVLENTWHYHASSHVPLEPHTVLAHFERGTHLTLWSSTQVPHYLQRLLAKVLNLPAEQIRVIKPAVGAAYGGKSEAFSLEFCAAELSRRTRRPVKITYDREEVFYTHRGRHEIKMRVKSGHKFDGRCTALELELWLDTGAYASFGVVTAYYAGSLVPLTYQLPAYKWQAVSVYTNKPPAGPKRGHGAVQPRFALECHLDEVAERLHLDPAELRRRNLTSAFSRTVNGLSITSNGLAECLDRVLKASGWERRGSLPPGRGLGLAVSAYISGAGNPIYPNDLPHSSVMMKADRSGLLTVFCGAAEIGQGSTEMFVSLIHQVLGWPRDAVMVVEGDTSLTPVDLGSYSSRVTFMMGNATLRACENLRQRLLSAVAARSGLAEGELVWTGAGVTFQERIVMTRGQALQVAEAHGGPLVVTGHYRPEGEGTFGARGVGPSPAYSFTAQVAEVEVDTERGEVKVLHLWCTHDCGKVLNPLTAVGQVEGCVYMGHGEALLEEMTYNPGGQLMNPSILEYPIPTIWETPPIHVELVESLDPAGPLGAKEVGEGPQLSTVPAIFNAVSDACGIRAREVPLTPPRLWKILSGRQPVVVLPVASPRLQQRLERRSRVLGRRQKGRESGETP